MSDYYTGAVEALETAANRVVSGMWVQSPLPEADRGCLVRTLGEVTHYDAFTFQIAINAVARTLQIPIDLDRVRAIGEWNDAPERTATEVANVMLAARDEIDPRWRR